MNIAHNITANVYVASNAQDYQGGSIRGQVTNTGIAYPCVVSVHERESRRVVESKQTDEVGNYEFENLSFGFYFFVMATDPASQYNAVIQDRIIPK